MKLWVQIEESGGPGLELGWEPGRGLVVTGVRGASWLGLDRAVVADTDVGDGSALPAVVALPHSAPAGASLRAELTGGYVDGDRTVMVATMPAHPLPIAALVRVAARIGSEARSLDLAAAERIVTRARHRYRRRIAEGRRTDQPAWLPLGIGTGSITATGHSGAERGLARLPPRFVRGLKDLLDADERILATAERPPEPDAGFLPWRQRERRAALLVLTDRQLAWLVDHVAPDRYLMDWGVDATLMPLEAVTSANATASGVEVGIGPATVSYRLAPEARRELDMLLSRLVPFIAPTGGGTAVRRRYALEAISFETDVLQPHRQAEEAADRLDRLANATGRPLLASFYAPRRERVQRAVAVALTEDALLVDDERDCRQLSLRGLHSIDLALSLLVGRIVVDAGEQRAALSYPAPLSAPATAFVRQLRRAWANVA